MTKEKLGAHGEMRDYDTKDGQYLPEDIKSMSSNELSEALKIDLSQKDKVNSVKIEQGKDNVLPKLSQEALRKMGTQQNKNVLVKKNIIERNSIRHKDVIFDTNKILGEVLYSWVDIFKGNKDKDYYTFYKPMRLSKKDGSQVFGLVLLDIDNKKEYFEVVHWHWIGEKDLEEMKEKYK